MPVAFHVGDVVRKLRKQMGLTGPDLAKNAGIDKSTVVDLERGVSDYKSNSLKKIADALGETVESLLAQVPPPDWPDLVRHARTQSSTSNPLPGTDDAARTETRSLANIRAVRKALIDIQAIAVIAQQELGDVEGGDDLAPTGTTEQTPSGPRRGDRPTRRTPAE